MMLDLIQFFGADLLDKNHEHCPVSFVELRGIRGVRCQRTDNPAGLGVIVEGVLYAFKQSDRAIEAARKLADLISSDDEQFQVAHASLYANKAARAIGEVVKEIEDK
jgi:hypothetical protein